ncbi:hypothetical protein ASG99_08370 [Bacillus sp. Soil768D1]|nr:hypothetical protein ASG99_08370 [Bacillus sp. Soil768D1]
MKLSILCTFSMLSLLVIVFSVLPNNVLVATAENGNKQITIFHTNDMHGHLLNNSNQIGIDIIASMKNIESNSLLIDAGDATQGLPFANLRKGKDVITLMNAAGYDGMALGNHEFDFGLEQVLKNVALAKFPVISANTIYRGKPLLAGINGNNGEFFIKEINGVEVGFFGITTQETAYKTNPNNVKGVTFEDPFKTAQNQVDKLEKEGADVIVGIVHIGNETSSKLKSEDIAIEVDGIDVLLDGHSHTLINEHVNGTLIAQTGSASANVGKVDITLKNDEIVEAKETLISKTESLTYKSEVEVANFTKKISESQGTSFNQVVGRTETPLWGATVNGIAIGRISETNLGDLIADSMFWSAASQVKESSYENQPIVSLINGGGIRDSIPEGIITRGQVISILPFGNILFLKEVSPAILYDVLENGVSKIESVNPKTGFITGVDGRYPQISGMRFEFDPSKTAANTTDTTKPFTKGERVTKIILLDAEGSDGEVLNRSDTTTKIVLASNNFETAGGDGYTMLKSLTNIGEGASLDIIFEEYITKLTKAGDGVFYYPVSKRRSRAVTSHVYYPYTAAITIKKGREIVANSEVVYTIDKGEPFKGKTDEKGILTIGHIKSGPHSIAISSKGLSTYIYVNDLIDSTIMNSSLGSEEYGNVSSNQFNQRTTRNNNKLQ